jgi:phosphoribosylformylglycinamidine synthase
MEKLLLEACLEVMATDACVGVQDMGAAGLTCATSETGSRGGVGVQIDVMHVPQRETGMTPYEIMLSESQERMLLIVKRGREAEVEAIFEKWDLHAVKIGEVMPNDRLRILNHGELAADVPNKGLTDEGPVYTRPTATPGDLDELRRIPREALRPLPAPADALRQILRAPTVANKRWIYRQYDHMVRTNTMVLAGLGASVVRVKGTNRALAMSVDGNGRFCRLDPRQGARLAVAEAARNVACAGALPIGATNCLNFGNPQRPEIMWQFAEAVAGIGDACRALEVPITGGNVSLYNETDGTAILPTPVIGVVGLIEDARRVTTRLFPSAGLAVVLFGENLGELGGSEYLKSVHGLLRGEAPRLDLSAEKALQGLLVHLVGDGLVESLHDCSEGGLAVALAECCFGSNGLGAEVSIEPATSDGGVDLIAATLFGESASRVVAGVSAARLDAVLARARSAGVPARKIGETGGSRLVVNMEGQRVLDVAIADAEADWANALSEALDGVPA